jgi:hypothetical protein
MRFGGAGLNRPSEMERYERTGKANHRRATGRIRGGQPTIEETKTLGLVVGGGSHGRIPIRVCVVWSSPHYYGWSLLPTPL